MVQEGGNAATISMGVGRSSVYDPIRRPGQSRQEWYELSVSDPASPATVHHSLKGSRLSDPVHHQYTFTKDEEIGVGI